jgi:hypothetical protein
MIIHSLRGSHALNRIGDDAMKKRVLILLGFLMCTGAVHAGIIDKLALRLNGGVGLISKGGDVKDLFASTYKRWHYLGNSGNLGNEYNSLGYSATFELEYPLAEKFSLGLASGYIAKTWTSDFALTTMYNNPSSGQQMRGTEEFSVGSIPLMVTGYYHASFRNVGLHAGAGAGLYFTSLRDDEGWNYIDPNRKNAPNYNWIVDATFDAKTKTAFGFHALVGASVPIKKNISFEVQAMYRNVAMDDFSGNWSEVDNTSWTGHSEQTHYSQNNTKLWLEESNNLGFKTLTADIGKTNPNDPERSRLFKIDLNGFYFSAGVKIDLALLHSL